MKIYLPYGEKRPRKPSHHGNRMEPHYVQRYDKNGHPYLVKDGETDIYAEIQSHKEECDINYLWQKYVAGDIAVIHPGAVYADISDMPSNMHEMVNFMTAQKERFKSLPAETKEKFENSFEVWAMAAGTDGWLEKMGLNQNTQQQKAEVNDNKQKQ